MKIDSTVLIRWKKMLEISGRNTKQKVCEELECAIEALEYQERKQKNANEINKNNN